MNAINLAQKLSTFTEHWQPRTLMSVPLKRAQAAPDAACASAVID